MHTARAHLLYGEWLRRSIAPRRREASCARPKPCSSRIGADAFADRARRELAASGEPVRRRIVDDPECTEPPGGPDRPTRRGGYDEPRIGARLFISAHTVEWHLRKVFTKFGISSRKQLSGSSSGSAASDEAIGRDAECATLEQIVTRGSRR